MAGQRPLQHEGPTLPVQTPAAARTQAAFRVLMNALSSPGEWLPLPAGAELDAPEPAALAPYVLIGETLLDLETTFYTPHAELRRRLLDTGAHPAAPHDADYLFLPELDAAALGALGWARRGDPLEPQRAATVLVGTELVGTGLVGAGHDAAGHGGAALTLSGPGIPGTRRAALGLPDAFWQLRRGATYPLGWDAFVLRGDGDAGRSAQLASAQVAGLPRTTAVEVS
ncbi:phosphonate C-P lyase system protein PhnH [Deinococcus koreensis]|uniref:Phosphonate C-P lyase system protein PhnH n=1 Tax=Deinococcus koreensis TaxID=2054903 RepID=A0A2K3UY30_9DEIO|nr:phosphonate C-P lyase system protein PhnH [Deinococcus koreensis]PNY81439.1 hypothetical protein CVO96_08630 [Deinococcus koreensis]